MCDGAVGVAPSLRALKRQREESERDNLLREIDESEEKSGQLDFRSVSGEGCRDI